MNNKSITLWSAALGMLFMAFQASAAWTNLPTAPSTTSPCGSSGSPSIRCTGIANQSSDLARLRIAPGSVASTSGGVTYYNFPSTFTLLDSLVTSFSSGSGSTLFTGTYYDYVFLDSTTNTLVFGSRLQMTGASEANDIFRSGFTGFTKQVAWTQLSSIDLRLYSTASSHTGLGQGADVYNSDYVDFRSDINTSEGNPWSGLYLVRTNATSYYLSANAIEIRQGGEEGQPILSQLLAGYVPGVAPVPEPAEYALMLLGLGIVGFVARRSNKKQSIHVC